MQALRRLAGKCVTQPPAGARGMAGGGYNVSAAQLEAGPKHGSETVDKIGVMVGLPAVGLYVLYDFLYPEEEFHGKIPPYPYLRLRTKETFPWGTENGMMEYHRFVQPKEE
eukprot:jgi/Chrzof1/10495/Cz05g00200.t1